MKDRLQQLIDKMNVLSLRERALVFGAVLVLLFTLWNELLMIPTEHKSKQAASQIEATEKRIASLDKQIEAIKKNAKQDPGKIVRDNLVRYSRELSELDQQIAKLAKNLISPKKMALVLQEMLVQVSGLNIIEVKSLEARPLLESSANEMTQQNGDLDKGTASPVLGVYQHRVVIEFEGEFQQTVQYLKMLEAMSWQIFWDHIDYTVEEYPKARVTIGVSTLSLSKGWIGV